MPIVTDVNLDKGEMLLRVDHIARAHKVDYGSISRLCISKQTVKKWFRTKTNKTIGVYVRGNEVPFIISSANVNDFDQVERYLKQVGEKFNIMIEDN